MNLSQIKNKTIYVFKRIIYYRNYKQEKRYWNRSILSVNDMGEDYYVIRNKGKVGLFSIYITALGYIKQSISKGLIPVIDLKNYRNVYLGIENVGKNNPWEEMFVQPSNEKLCDIERKARKLIYCDTAIPNDRPNDETDFLYSLNDYNNEWRILARDYMKVSPRILDDAKKEFSKLSMDGKEKVIGVLCRGTDYIKLRPKDHPVQPEIEEMLSKIDDVIRDYRCDKIFLATEDSYFEKCFKERYGDKLYTIDEKKLDYQDGYLNDSIKFQNQEVKMQTGINYLKKILILAMCQCFIAGRTSGTIGVMLQDHDFEYTHFFDKGRY